MSSIEQAIYTSAHTHHADGYQVVAHSPGAADVDLREIAAWAPSHDSLADVAPGAATSANFHPLPSGAYCVSRTTAAGGEFSGRGGQRIYTHCLIVPADVLLRFGNNPFAVLTAASAQGALAVRDAIPDTIEPIQLGGKAAAADRNLLASLVADIGPVWLAAAVHAVATSQVVALVAGEGRQRLLNGVLSLFPVACRTHVSLSTGLRFSPRRPCRLIGVPSDSLEQLKALKRHGVPTLDPRDKPPAEFAHATGWAGLIAAALAAGKLQFLIGQLGQSRPGIGLEQLDSLGNTLREALAQAPDGPSFFPPLASSSVTGAPAPFSASRSAPPLLKAEPPAPAKSQAPIVPAKEPALALEDPAEANSEQRRADGAHPSRARDAAPAARPVPLQVDDSPSLAIGWQCPAALELLEAVDDLVFEAIAGKSAAVDLLRTAWPAMLAKLGPSLVEESRENYVRHALRVWKECLDGDQIRQPSLAISAMEVVCILCNI